MDRDVEVIHIGHPNTVRTLRDQLAKLVATGYANTGFPILRSDVNDNPLMLGFIGRNELEHALSMPSSASCSIAGGLIWHGLLGIVADDADHPVSFQSNGLLYRTLSVSSISSIVDPDDPFDFSVYMNKVRLPRNFIFRKVSSSSQPHRLH
jgi:chloride channel 3/4/5